MNAPEVITAPVSPEEQARAARVERIATLNAKLTAYGRRDSIVGENASDKDIERAERLTLHDEIRQQVAAEFPQLEAALLNQKTLERFRLRLLNSGASPRLAALVAEKDRLASAASAAAGLAENATQRALALHSRIEAVHENIDAEQKRLVRVRQAKDSVSAELARIDDGENLVVRYADMGHQTNSMTPQMFAEHVDFGRLVLRAAIDDGSRCEEIINGRIAKLRTELAALEEQAHE